MTASVALVLLVSLQAGSGGANLQDAIARFQAGDCRSVVAMLSREPEPPPAVGDLPYDLPYVLLAACHFQLGQPALGVQTARRGLAALPQSGLLKRLLGQQLFREDPFNPEVGVLLDGAVEALPGDAESRHYFAQWAYMNNRDAECTDREREALAAPGLNPVALLQMHTLVGMCEGRSGDAAAARIAFETAWTINTSLARFDVESAYRYVRFLSDHGEPDELARLVGEVLQRAPRHGPTLVERAKLLRQDGKATEAIDAATRALDGESNDAVSTREAHIVLARSYFMLGEREKADAEQAWIDEHPVAPVR